MNIGTRIISYAVLPLCVLSVALRPNVAVEASATPSTIQARFLTVLPNTHSFAYAMQAKEIPIPEGKGSDVTKRVCTGCHSSDLWASQRHTKDEWSGVIDQMLSKGLQASDDEIETINTYLATYLGPAPKKDADPSPSK
jgi:cytochrome c5